MVSKRRTAVNTSGTSAMDARLFQSRILAVRSLSCGSNSAVVMASPDADAALAASVFYLAFYFAFRLRTLTIGRPPYAHFSFQPAANARYSVATIAVVDPND